MTRLWETDNLYLKKIRLTVNIARLRRKLDKAGLTDFLFSTKVGEGYIYQTGTAGERMKRFF